MALLGWRREARTVRAKNAGGMTNDPHRQRLNDSERKLIEMDDKKSHGAKGRGAGILWGRRRRKKKKRSRGRVCFCAALCVGMQTGGSESCIFGIPPGQVAIGSASLGGDGGDGGRDRVDMRIWFAY